MNLSFSTPASIEAFCVAEADRRAYHRGVAPEMHLHEPESGAVTKIRKRPVGLPAPEAWWATAETLPDIAVRFYPDDEATTAVFVPEWARHDGLFNDC